MAYNHNSEGLKQNSPTNHPVAFLIDKKLFIKILHEVKSLICYAVKSGLYPFFSFFVSVLLELHISIYNTQMSIYTVVYVGDL